LILGFTPSRLRESGVAGQLLYPASKCAYNIVIVAEKPTPRIPKDGSHNRF